MNLRVRLLSWVLRRTQPVIPLVRADWMWLAVYGVMFASISAAHFYAQSQQEPLVWRERLGVTSAQPPIDPVVIAVVGGILLLAMCAAVLSAALRVVSWAEWERRDGAARVPILDPWPDLRTRDSVFVAESEFAAIIDEALCRLPPDVRAELDRRGILVGYGVRASREEFIAAHMDPEHAKIAAYYGGPTEQITLFAEHIITTHDRDDLARGTAQVLYHEVGHALGLDHGALAELGV